MKAAPSPPPVSPPSVSIILVVRDEVEALRRCLTSLTALDYPHSEIIVVDIGEHSETAQIAAHLGARLVRSRPLPEFWGAAAWWQWQGAYHASGQLLLFTEVCTEYRPDALRRAVAELHHSGVGLLSARAYAVPRGFVARCMGSLHLLCLALRAPYAALSLRARVNETSKNASGSATHRSRYLCFVDERFLLIKRSIYRALEGHRYVREERSPLSHLVARAREHRHVYGLYPQSTAEAPLYVASDVGSLREACRVARDQCWTLWETRPSRFMVEFVLLNAAVTGAGAVFDNVTAVAIAGLMMLCVALWQRRYGAFHVIGACLTPVGLVLLWVAAVMSAQAALRRAATVAAAPRPTDLARYL